MRAAQAALFVLLLMTGTVDGAERGQPYEFPLRSYVHIQWRYAFEEPATPRHGFVLRRARAKFRHSFTKAVRTEVEVGFDELALTLKDAFFEYEVGAPLRVVVGLKKMPFSREELYPVSNLLAIERSETNDKFGDRGYLGRDIGIALEGEVQAGRFPVGYAAGVFNGNGGVLSRDNDDAKQFCERVTIAPLERCSVGLNATQRNDTLTGRVALAYGGDLECRLGSATIQAEALAGDRGLGRRMLGGHLTAAYRFNTIEPAVRAERFYSDLGQLGDQRTALVAGLNWYLHRLVQLKVNLVADICAGQDVGYEAIVQAQAGL